MRRIVLILAAVIVALLAAGAGAIYAYDESRQDVIAKGVVAGGVDISGLTMTEAFIALRRELRARYLRPVMLRHGEMQFALSPESARIRFDIGGMLRDALQRSRQGSLVKRVWRDATGDRLNVSVPARATYSKQAVDVLVERVREELRLEPTSATAKIELRQIRTTPSRNGQAVRTGALSRAVRATLLDPERPRTIDVPLRVLEPAVTTEKLRKRYTHVITVDRTQKRLRLFERLRLVKTYKVAIGQIGYDTPAGVYEIRNKAINPSWYVPRSRWTGNLAGRIIPPGPENPIKARWMGFYNGAGIHGTDAISSLGSAASHGCIRMSIPDVVDLYDRVPMKTPLYIA